MSEIELLGFMKAASEAIDLEIPDECEAGVLENLAKNFAMAKELLAFRLQEDEEQAPVFTP
ncbi:MAG TPA: DUF4089 domain-containing protein [Chthoniobacterales bacterium]